MDVTLQKRGSTFATHTEHTEAFTTVHIIAAVIGVVGAIAVTISIFLYCKKRKNDSLLKIKADIEQDMIQHVPASTRFGQFANDFDHAVNPDPALSNTVTPMMQQHQLQIKLLQVPTHNRSPSSSNTVMPPPPPYQP